MCGIAGTVNYQIDINQLKKDLSHRGPDSFGHCSINKVNFYHFRLSIIDIGGGQQPKRLLNSIIIFNGEIYNHLELRTRYGLKCETESDTETLLHLYDKLGIKMLNELDGMFAFALLDENLKKLFLARDRAGKKPLYYYRKNNSFVFASEINALRNQVDVSMNEANLQNYFRLGFMFGDQTPYNEIKELQPASLIELDVETFEFKQKKWWDISKFYLTRSDDSLQTATDKIDQLLHTGIKRRLLSSDLEVGSFLSSGIDSSLITAIASQYTSKLKTFTVRFPGAFDESKGAMQVSKKYDTDHFILDIDTTRLLDQIEDILYSYGEPFADDSAIPSYLMSKSAKEKMTVILNGDGGDELFGGYRRYVPFAYIDLYKFNFNPVAWVPHLIPKPNNKMNRYNYVVRLLQMFNKKGAPLFLSSTSDIFEQYLWLLKEKQSQGLSNLIEDLTSNKSLSGLKKSLMLDFHITLPNGLLVKMDIATMAHALEGRSPFLSKELMEYVPTINDKFKINRVRTKHILRNLAKKYLPTDLANAPKRGFEPPLVNWVNNDLKPIIDHYIFNKEAFYKEFIFQDSFLKIYNREIKISEVQRIKMIWTIFSFEVWYHRCYGRK